MKIRSVPSCAVILISTALILAGCSASPQVKSARYIENGKKLMQKGDASRAVLEFRNAVQVTPNDAEAEYQLALAYISAGDLAKGIAGLRKTLELNPKHAAARLRLAQFMGDSGDPQTMKEAQQRLQALLADSPENTDALQSLALTELKLGAADSAMQHLQQALGQAPTNIILAVSLAEAKALAKDFKGAEQVLIQATENSPSSADAFAVLGRFYLLEKKYPDSEKALQHALTLQPDHGWSLMTLGLLYNTTGRNQEAEQAFKKVSTSPNPSLRYLYGNFLFGAGRRDDAIREFERLVKADPADRAARTRLVAAYQGANRTADADKLLADALKKNPKDLDALLQRGEMHLAAKQYTEAETDLNRVVHLRPDSPEVHYALAALNRARGTLLVERQELGEALRLNPSFLAARLSLAKGMMGQDLNGTLSVLDQAPADQKERIELIEQRNFVLIGMHRWADARAGVDHGLSMDRTPALLFQAAGLNFMDKRFDDARKSLHEAMAKAPEDLDILRLLVETYAQQKQMPAAIKELQEHAEKHPESAPVRYFLGVVLSGNGDSAKAKETFASAKKISPDFIPAALALAQIDLKNSNWDVARQELSAILSKQENPQARFWLGNLEESVGNPTAAIVDYRKVLDSQPNNSMALNNLAALLGETPGQVDEALKYAQKAKELEPESAPVDDTLGWILYRKGLYPSAVQYLERANKRGPTAQLKYHLAMAYLKNGQTDRGRSLFQEAKRLQPNSPEAKLASDLFR